MEEREESRYMDEEERERERECRIDCRGRAGRRMEVEEWKKSESEGERWMDGRYGWRFPKSLAHGDSPLGLTLRSYSGAKCG